MSATTMVGGEGVSCHNWLLGNFNMRPYLKPRMAKLNSEQRARLKIWRSLVQIRTLKFQQLLYILKLTLTDRVRAAYAGLKLSLSEISTTII